MSAVAYIKCDRCGEKQERGYNYPVGWAEVRLYGEKSEYCTKHIPKQLDVCPKCIARLLP